MNDSVIGSFSVAEAFYLCNGCKEQVVEEAGAYCAECEAINERLEQKRYEHLKRIELADTNLQAARMDALFSAQPRMDGALPPEPLIEQLRRWEIVTFERLSQVSPGIILVLIASGTLAFWSGIGIAVIRVFSLFW